MNDQTNDTDEISAEYVILEHEGKRAGLEADDQKVHEIVVLDAFVFPQKDDDCDVKTRKGQHLEVIFSGFRTEKDLHTLLTSLPCL